MIAVAAPIQTPARVSRRDSRSAAAATMSASRIGVRFKCSKLLCNGFATAATARTTGAQAAVQARAQPRVQPRQSTFSRAQPVFAAARLQRATSADGRRPSAVNGGHGLPFSGFAT